MTYEWMEEHVDWQMDRHVWIFVY